MDFSELVTVFLTILVSCLFILSLWRNKQRYSAFPPGPISFPVIGNILQLERKAPYRALLKLSEKYGPVFSVSLGSQRVVVLCGYEAVKEALIDQGDDFSGREPPPVINNLLKGYGILVSNGERWKQLRRFSLMTLRNFGMGKKSTEERIQEEARFLLDEFRKTKGLPFDPTLHLSKAVSNIICTIVFGDRYDYSDGRFHTLLQLLNDSFSLLSSLWGEIYNVFPNVMRYIPGPHKRLDGNFQKLKDFVLENIESHQQLLDVNSPQDYIDSFLIKMQQEKNNAASEFCKENLIASTLNLFFAGTETTSTTLRYGFLIFLKYPHVQETVQKEIDHVIGGNRCPAITDRMKMPYTEAVLHEIQRFIDLIPMNLPHRVMQDTTFRGYTIPKGTAILPLLTSVLHDKSLLETPDMFNPKHFLEENGFFKKNDCFIPFSTGKRICLGKGLAQMELFLFFTTILQNFTLKPLADPAEIDIAPQKSGFGNVPPPYKFCVVSR